LTTAGNEPLRYRPHDFRRIFAAEAVGSADGAWCGRALPVSATGRSGALRVCHRVGAERFGWARRSQEVRSMRDENWLAGYGMAGVTFMPGEAPCQATVSIRHDGTAHVRSAATDLGTGTYQRMLLRLLSAPRGMADPNTSACRMAVLGGA
jgi:CO/xanthine dehydrogenase Mo-binding subunit